MDADDLESTGALQATNRMSIKALLNPEGKCETMDESTDEEIYQVVINAINACENIDWNCGGDADSDDGPVQTCPTACKVLQAAVTLNRYMMSWMILLLESWRQLWDHSSINSI